ncbi:MAG TPA: hypothetical protein VIS99_14480, partial [Terrimicrobiaceae bacterium]
LLRGLVLVREPETLERLLSNLVSGTADLPEGLPPDSPAISTIKRLLEIDFGRGVDQIRALIRPRIGLPFSFGYFQISLVGTLLAATRKARPPKEFAAWIWSEIEYLRHHGLRDFGDRSLCFALTASLTALGLISESSNSAALTRIEQQIGYSLDAAVNNEEKSEFLRFLGDSLNQGVDSNNFALHLSKLTVFLKAIAYEPSILRQQNRLLCLVRELLAPAKEILSK